MPRKEEIDQILAQTLEDRRLSRSEKRALSEVIAEWNLDDEGRAFVRNRAFLLAKDSVGKDSPHEVVGWLEDVVKVLLPRSAAGAQPSATVLFSPGDECRHKIALLCKSARKCIDICVFTVTDDRLAAEILAAHQRGIAVRFLADNDKAYDRGADVDRLRSAGVPVAVDVTDHHMHHKFAVFDKRTVLTGSYNWTRSAAKYNHENIVVTDDPTIATPYQVKFDELWAELGPS